MSKVVFLNASVLNGPPLALAPHTIGRMVNLITDVQRGVDSAASGSIPADRHPLNTQAELQKPWLRRVCPTNTAPNSTHLIALREAFPKV